MNIQLFPDAESVARAAAAFVASESRAAIAERGRFVAALSGGSTPWLMLRDLVDDNIRWEAVQFVQVDERIAPAGDTDRNLVHIQQNLVEHTPLRAEQIHAMPVEAADPEKAAAGYAETLAHLAGVPPLLDLIHLGLGADGHTASLVPGDPVLDVLDADVAVTQVYQGRRRMTLTYPILNRARRILWLVTGVDKAEALRRLEARDPSIPAGRVSQRSAVVFTDSWR